MAIKKILVPTDFSDGALDALEYAIDLARKLDAELLIVFVVEPVFSVTGADLYSGAMDPSVVLEEQKRIGDEQLSHLENRLRKRAVRFGTLLATGTASLLIPEVAQTSGADLIVMATHGRAGFSHLLMGSVTEKVIRTAPCPVLTFRPRRWTERRPSKPRTTAS